MYSGIYYGFDPTVLLLIIGVILSLVASSRLKSTFATYSRVRSASGMTGAQAAQRILNSRGLYDVPGGSHCRKSPQITMTPGQEESVCLRPVTISLLWQRWEWQPMSVAMPCSTRRTMAL